LQTQVLAFVNDKQEETGFPTIVKLTKSEFEGTSIWLDPDIMEIMNAVVNPTKVLPLPEIANTIKTTKFILIPLFLVPFFIP